jgi:gliding motility-associated-like protein
MAFIRLFSFFFLVTTFHFSFGQLENHNWYFGTSSVGGIAFNKNNVPSIIANKYAAYAREGGSVATNPLTGKLIFYTDGLVVVDAQNKLMPNGHGLISSTITYTAQTGTIAPIPNKCTQYYIFTTNADGRSGTLYYSIVDMALQGNGTSTAPLGDVVPSQKNIPLSSDVSEAMISIPGSDNNTYWLLSPIYKSTKIQIFKITLTGIQQFNTFDTGVLMQDQRSIRYSKTTGKIALSSFHGVDPLLLMNFDNSTGAISNVTKVPGTPLEANSVVNYGIFDQVFSADGSKLYISLYRGYSPSTGGKLFQYDLNNPTAAVKEIYKINTTNEYYASLGLQLGPDNKVYWLYTNQTYADKRIIGRIEYPDSAGTNCVVNPVFLDFGQSFNGVKFPEFLPYNNHKPLLQNDNYTLNCGVNGLIIDPLLNDSDIDNDKLTASVLKVKFGNATSNSNKFNYQINSSILGEVLDTINYKVCDVTCFSKCDSAIVAIKITNTSDAINLGKDTAICDGSTLLLNAGQNFTSYKWQDDSNLQSYIVTHPGTYWVLATNACGPAGDTIIISSKTVDPIFLGKDTTICNGNFIHLNAGLNSNSFQWQDGSTSSEYIVSNPGEYWVRVTGDCGVSTDTIIITRKDYLIPNLVTANNDGYNDTFKIPETSNLTNRLEIFNRWGAEVYSNNNYKNDWDGKDLSAGIYYYKLDIEGCKSEHGWLQLTE